MSNLTAHEMRQIASSLEEAARDTKRGPQHLSGDQYWEHLAKAAVERLHTIVILREKAR